MAYLKRIVCLAASFKPPDGRCIAGIEVLPQGGFGDWIRPVSSRPTEEVSFIEYRYQGGGDPALLDILDVPLLRATPRDHQVENHEIDPTGWWVKRDTVSWEELSLMKSEPDSLWQNGCHTSTGLNDCLRLKAGRSLAGSLLLVKIDTLTLKIAAHSLTGKRVNRALFKYHGTDYSLSLTDPVMCKRLATIDEGLYSLDQVYLCVSLTLPYIDGRCHKLAAAVMTNPPL